MRFLIFLLFIPVVSFSQVDMISTKNDVKLGVHIGLDGTTEGFARSSLTVRMHKFIENWGMLISIPLPNKFEQRLTDKPDIYKNRSDYELVEVGGVFDFFYRTRLGVTYNIDNWFSIYGAFIYGKGNLYLSRTYQETSSNNRVFGYEKITDSEIAPEFGFSLTPFRFVSGSFGYDFAFETFSFDIAVGWYFKSERGRNNRGSYRRRRR